MFAHNHIGNDYDVILSKIDQVVAPLCGIEAGFLCVYGYLVRRLNSTTAN